MILRTGNVIRRPMQRVFVDGSVDDRFFCNAIRLGTYSGLTEADFLVPEWSADSIKDKLRDSAVKVYVDGSGDVHFYGYLAVDSCTLSPTEDGVVLHAYTITKWLNRYHVGQFTRQWEVTYPIINKVTKTATGLTPALILMHLFSQLPKEVSDRLKLGDISVLHQISSAPDITFRLCNYAEAINQLMAYVGDVAFRERFQGNITYLDFYRINTPGREKASVRHASWTDASRANVQSSQGQSDSTNIIDRVVGFGGYRQFMVTCRNYISDIAVLSEPEEAARLVNDWDTTLEDLALKSPELTITGGKFSIKCAEEADENALVIKVKVPLDRVPVGSYLTTPSGETMKVTAFSAKTETNEAAVTVTRGLKDTEKKPIKMDDAIGVRVPGMEHVFRRFRLPAALNGCAIQRSGCKLDAKGAQYPQEQSFFYDSTKIRHKDDGEGNPWVEGRMPHSLQSVAPTTSNVSLNVEKRTVIFPKPVVALMAKKPKRDKDNNIVMENGGPVYESIYRQTVCGITLTVENQAYPFFYDTGARPTTAYDFNEVGFTDRWQKNEFQYWQLATGPMTINGVAFPCIYFPPEPGLDDFGQPMDPEIAYYIPAETGLISRTDFAGLKTLCEQTLRSNNRRSRSWTVTIPWFSPGYKVGSGIEIDGLENFPRDIYKITGVEHSMGLDGSSSTTIQIDNVKPPVRYTVEV